MPGGEETPARGQRRYYRSDILGGYTHVSPANYLLVTGLADGQPAGSPNRNPAHSVDLLKPRLLTAGASSFFSCGFPHAQLRISRRRIYLYMKV